MMARPDLGKGFSLFFGSDSVSDAQLRILLPRVQAPAGTGAAASCSGASTSASPPAAPGKKTPGRKRKAGLPQPPNAEDGAWQQVACFPVHRVILMAKCAYFGTLLLTDLRKNSSAIITEHAGSRQEVQAIIAALECVYSDKLPLLNTSGEEYEGDDSIVIFTQMQKRIMMLEIFHRWQSPSSIAECCSTICDQATETATWEDCYTIFSMPEWLREQPDIVKVTEWAMDNIVALSKIADTAPQQTAQQLLSARLHKLSSSVRLALLKGKKLSFAGMISLLSSEEQIAGSEDNFALLLCRYLEGEEGKNCSALQTAELKAQLRFQHMSSAFLAFQLQSIPLLSLDLHEIMHVMYLRSIKGDVGAPREPGQPSYPAAWYMRPRQHATPPPDSIQLTLKIPESDLAEHLKAAALLGAGAAVPRILSGAGVEFAGISWSLCLASSSIEGRLLLYVLPTLTADAGLPARNTGIYVEATYSLDSASPVITVTLPPVWAGHTGRGFTNFVQQFGKRPGDPTQLDWWKDYIDDGCVHFSAAVKLL